jgi:multidrug transporter EmrE-like cation transporter
MFKGVKRAILDSQSNQWVWIFASVLCYLVLIYVYWIIFSEKKINVMVVYFIIKIASIMAALVIGMIWFGYRLNWESILGLIFGIASIMLLSKNSGH